MDQIGQPLATAATVARSESAVVALTGLTVYSTGFEFALTARLSEELDPTAADILGHRARVLQQEVAQIPDEVLRIGVEYPDGRRATSLDRPLHPIESADPELYLQVGGGGRGWDFKCWCWPLPPPGAFDLVCEWPAKSISLTRLAVDADQIREAARHVTSLWP